MNNYYTKMAINVLVGSLTALGFFCLISLLTACGSGKDGANGAAGGQGKVGQAGSPGLQGAPGIPGGSNVIPVQFCDGTPTYPTNFLEVGLCIDNQLYAVYWNGQAALTLLPPGTYGSTSGGGTNCVFTVSDNCAISH